MKKVCTIVLIFFLRSFSSFAQTNVYHPFPQANAVWTQTFSAYWGQACANWNGMYNPLMGDQFFSYTMEGDTLINGITYHKIYKAGTSHQRCNYGPSNYPWYPIPHQYIGAYREDIALKKIYKYQAGQENLMYDFSITTVGASVALPNSCMVTITSVDSVLVGPSYHKRINYSSMYSIIEGIGSTNGLFEGYCPYFESGGGIICFMVNNVRLYPDTIGNCEIMTTIKQTQNNFPIFSIAPNPSSGIFHVSGLQIEYAMDVYDINGKLVYSKAFSDASSFIDISKNNKGLYYYKIMDDYGNSSHGILVLE